MVSGTLSRQENNVTEEVSIDVLIAEKIMRWTRHGDVWRDKYGMIMGQVATDENNGLAGVFRPQSDDASAFRVVDMFKRPHWQFRLEYGVFTDASWTATFSCDKPLIVATASAGTRQLAVCRAAWKAVQERGK